MPTDILAPRRAMFLGLGDSSVLDLLKKLTGSIPNLSQGSGHQDSQIIAGLSHSLRLETKYYNATVPVWLDDASCPTQWERDFATAEAAEVVRAIGAWIIVFRLGGSSQYRADTNAAIGAVGRVIDAAYEAEGGREAWDGVLLAVSIAKDGSAVNDEHKDFSKEREHTEDICLENHFEFVDASVATSTNDRDKQGLLRVREALESNDWEPNAEAASPLWSEDGGDDIDGETFGFQKEAVQMRAEFTKLNSSLRGEAADESDQESQVEGLTTMLHHLQAARDMSTHLPMAQRKTFAAKAVRDLLKDLE